MLFLPIVDPHVASQGARLGESFVTFMTRMWFLPSVDQNMGLQVARLGESLVTFLAGVWLLPVWILM